MRRAWLLLLVPLVARADERPRLGFRPAPFVSQVETLQEARELPSGQLDLGYTALLVARLANPKLDLERQLARLDALARAVLAALPERPTPHQAVAAISRQLFETAGLRYHDGPADGVDPHNAYLDRTLDDRKGFCLSLSVLYLAVAERINLPLKLVEAPRHVFVRYDDGRTRFNIETTAGGKPVSDDDYRRRFAVPPAARAYYLKSRPPRQAVAYLLMSHGSILWRADRASEAQSFYRDALAWDPANPHVQYNLAGAELRLGSYPEALALYDRFLVRHPDSALGRLGRARTLLRLSRVDECRAVLAKVDPKLLEAILIRAELALLDRRYDEVHRLLRGPLSRQSPGRYLAGRTYLAQGKHALAEPLFRELVRAHPAEIEYRRKLGVSLRVQGKLREALVVFERALAQAPRDLFVLASLGELHRELGQATEARRFFERYRRAGGRDPSILAWLRR